MKTLLYTLAFLLPCAFARAGNLPNTDPWPILASRENLVSADALSEARKAVFEEAEDTPSDTVARLVRLWKDNSFSNPVAITWACELAAPRDVGVILQTVREVLTQEGDPQHPELTDRLNRFFFHDCLALWDKMPNPDLLVQLLEQAGRTIWHLPLNPAERQWLMLARLREQRSIVLNGRPRSWIDRLSPETCAELLRFARYELHDKDAEAVAARLAEERCQIALDTLANHSVVEALPLIKELLTKLQPLGEPAALIGKLKLCAVKLEHENDASALLEVARTERNNRRLLHWAAWRYLMSGGQLSRLREALTENRTPAQTGPHAGEDVTAALRFVIFGEGSDTYALPDGQQVTRAPRDFTLGTMVDTFLLNGRQVENLLDLTKRAQDERDSGPASAALLDNTYKTILERAKP